MDDSYKRGTFVRRVTVSRPLAAAEMARIPEAHRPSGPVMRSEMQIIPMPPFNKVGNRVGVIFDGETPMVT
jgi:tRNA(His) guanylyltransferase